MKRQQKEKMHSRPETIFYDYKYECDNSDILAMNDEPANAKFWTERPDAWFRASYQHYNQLYENSDIKKKPEVRFPGNGQIGKQILIPDNNDPDEGCYLTLFFYNTGVILIQGRGCGKWEHTDMVEIKPAVVMLDDKPSDLHQTNLTPASPTSMSHSLTQASTIHGDDLNTTNLDHLNKSAPRLSLARRLYKAASFLIPRSNSTPKSNLHTTLLPLSRTLPSQGAECGELSDSVITQHSEDICLDATNSQQLLFEMSSRNSLVAEFSSSDEEFITPSVPITPSSLQLSSTVTNKPPSPQRSPIVHNTPPSPQLSPVVLNTPPSPTLGLPRPHQVPLLEDKLIEAERVITVLTTENEILKERNKQLELNMIALQTSCGELNENNQTLQAQLLSLQQPDNNNGFINVTVMKRSTK